MIAVDHVTVNERRGSGIGGIKSGRQPAIGVHDLSRCAGSRVAAHSRP